MYSSEILFISLNNIHSFRVRSRNEIRLKPFHTTENIMTCRYTYAILIVNLLTVHRIHLGSGLEPINIVAEKFCTSLPYNCLIIAEAKLHSTVE